MDPLAGKTFFINRVIEEAEAAGIPLSTVEKQMLAFSETHPASADIYQINEEFERDYDGDEYEDKIVDLLKRSRQRNHTEANERQWREALQAFCNQDHYILVMLHRAFPDYRKTLQPTHRIRDYVIYTAIGIGVVLLLVVAVILVH